MIFKLSGQFGRIGWTTVLAAVVFLASGCAALVGSATQGFAEDLAAAILDNEDPAMVRDGAPSYLILVDSLVSRSPKNDFLMQQSANLHAAYAAAFVDEEARSRLLYSKAKRQALAATCLAIKNSCDVDRLPFQAFATWVEARKASEVPVLFTLATSWAGWVQSHSDDFTAVADLAKVKLLMSRTAELDPGYQDGSVYLYLGVFETLFPPAMGGRPELGREYFEQAIDRSNGQNLLAKVAYAENYARLVFDRELHDRLLSEVMEAPAQVPGLTLMNSVAKEQAQQLLDSADDYF